MKQSGSQRIHASRRAVWSALNDTRVLKRCIEGCETFERVGEQSYKATVRAHIGPVNALFAARVELAEVPQDNPNLQNFLLNVELDRAPAGFGRGSAKVSLAEERPNVTVLNYEIDAVVGGKLAQLGARLIESAARSMASSFFGNLQSELGGRVSDQSKASHKPARSNALRLAAAVGMLLAVLAVIIAL